MDTEQCFNLNSEFPGKLANWMADNNILCKILCIFGNSVQFTKFSEFCGITEWRNSGGMVYERVLVVYLGSFLITFSMC